MEDGFVPCMSPPPLPAEECGGPIPIPSWPVLLDATAYISAAAAAAMSNGAPIHVSFLLARPPRLSYLCVHYPCPALGAAVDTVVGPARGTPAVRCVRDPPLVVATHADLALLRVSIPGSLRGGNPSTFNYFVYAAASPSLELIPKPTASPRGSHEQGFRDQDVAIVRCSGGYRYAIAVLRNTLSSAVEFTLQIYDSDTHDWSWKLLTVEAPERDSVLPIPDSATELLFHNTTKIITLDSTTVGWVDLWRGILFCNVLDEKPVLRDMPLPKPSRCNRGSFCQGISNCVEKLGWNQQGSGKYYVVDASYPNRPGYLAPYKGERYHLPEWHRGMEPNTPTEKFNRVHSSIRNVIERSFGVLKMKWQILYKMPGYSMLTQKKIVAATMVLHNFIREDADFANFDRDPPYVPTIPDRYNKYVVPVHASDGSTEESSFITMDTFHDSLATSVALAWN